MVSSKDIELIIDTVELLDNGSADRKTIAEALKINQNTAGAVANTLISAKIASENTRRDSSPGRKSGVLTLRHDQVFALIHITAKEIRTEFLGFNLSTVSSGIYEVDDPLFIDDVFTAFFRHLHKAMPGILGVCLVCSGVPDDGCFIGSGIPGIDRLSLLEMAAEHLPGVHVILENSALGSLTDTSGLTAVISDENGSVRVSLINNGELISGKRGLAGHMGCVKDNTGRSLGAKIRYAKDHREYSAAMAELFSQVILLTDPHRICFSSEKYSSEDDILCETVEKLTVDFGFSLTDIPEMFTKGDVFDPSLTGLKRKLRNSYISKMLKESI